MVKKILLILLMMGVTMTIYCQIYEITEDELRLLETTIERQKNLLEEQAQLLSDLKQEIESLRTRLEKAKTSFAEYENGAKLIQESLQAEAGQLAKQKFGWQTASVFIGVGALIGGTVLGWQLGKLPTPQTGP